MMRKTLAATLLLGGCASALQQAEPVRPPFPLSSAPISLEKIVNRIPRGAKVGQYILFLNCRAPWGAVTWGEVRRRAPETELTDQLFQELAAAGYTLVGDRRSPFAPPRQAEFRLAASIEDLDLELCRQTDWLFGYSTGISGEAKITVDWQLFSERSRGVVSSARTVGHAERSTGTTDGVGLLIVDAFANAAEQLARDPGFAAALAETRPAEASSAPPRAASPPQGRANPLRVGEAVYPGGGDRLRREGGIIAALRWDEGQRHWVILADLPTAVAKPEVLYDAAGIRIGVAAPDAAGDLSIGLVSFRSLGPVAAQP